MCRQQTLLDGYTERLKLPPWKCRFVRQQLRGRIRIKVAPIGCICGSATYSTSTGYRGGIALEAYNYLSQDHMLGWRCGTHLVDPVKAEGLDDLRGRWQQHSPPPSTELPRARGPKLKAFKKLVPGRWIRIAVFSTSCASVDLPHSCSMFSPVALVCPLLD